MKLNFLINENYLIIHTLASMEPNKFSSRKNQKEIIDFQNFAWKKSEKVYNFLVGRLCGEGILDINSLLEKIPDFFKAIKRSSYYKKILLETRDYLLLCEKQWMKNYLISKKIIGDLTGFKLNKSFTVYITHPSLKNGHYLGKNKISWGHNEDWPNYTTVYLWHEILHSYFDNNDFNHALIQFIADNELRIRLNGGKYPPFIGHKNLFSLMKKMLPYWRKYLEWEEKKNIYKFQNNMLKMEEFSTTKNPKTKCFTLTSTKCRS